MTGQQCTGSFHSHFFARLAARAACAALALLLCSCTGPGGDGRVEELSLDIEQLQADIDGLRANFQEMQDTMLDIEDMKASVAKLEKWIGQGGSGAAGGADFSADILTLKQQLQVALQNNANMAKQISELESKVGKTSASPAAAAPPAAGFATPPRATPVAAAPRSTPAAAAAAASSSPPPAASTTVRATPTPAPRPPEPARQEGYYLEIRPGDTVEFVSEKTGVSASQIRSENRIPQGKQPMTTRLWIPGPRP